VSNHLIDQLVYGAIRLGLLDAKNATRVGRMLTNANKRSIRARYGPDDLEAKRVRTYSYFPPLEPISDVSLYKQVAHYDYQTCEFDGYETSGAGRFVARMWRTLEARGVNRTSPGYSDAPWGLGSRPYRIVRVAVEEYPDRTARRNGPIIVGQPCPWCGDLVTSPDHSRSHD